MYCIYIYIYIYAHRLDRASTVGDVSFTDYDLDDGDLGGSVLWTAPNDTSQVTEYVVYFAYSNAGNFTSGNVTCDSQPGCYGPACCDSRASFGSVTVGTDDITVPVDTPALEHTSFLVYTLSSLVEQSTPALVGIFDANASVSGVLFVDKDLDPGQMGGTISWTAPPDASRVEFYVAIITDSYYY